MAITRAQQYRQMLREGSKKPVMQGGGPNYLGKQPEVTTPKKWKSSPEHPDTELAYITEPEKQVLIALNMHGGLEDGKPNKGPKGIISLDGGGSFAEETGGYTGSTTPPSSGSSNQQRPPVFGSGGAGGGGGSSGDYNPNLNPAVPPPDDDDDDDDQGDSTPATPPKTDEEKKAAKAKKPEDLLKILQDNIDPRKYNGALLVGLNGVVVKSHGSTDSFGFYNAIMTAIEEIKKEIIQLNHIKTGGEDFPIQYSIHPTGVKNQILLFGRDLTQIALAQQELMKTQLKFEKLNPG